jgi:glycosyltransferase involved in cell wall biosynthesis
MSEPGVSVVLPSFQRRRSLLDAIESVLAQTRRDFELIVIDDGSTDGTGEAVRGLDPRIRYRWQPNRGVSAARNAALRMTRAEVVAFIDSDDRWRPHHLEAITGLLERHPEAVVASACPHYVEPNSGADDERVVDVMPDILLGGIVGYMPCVAARREALFAVGQFDVHLTVGEDSDLWARLALRGPFCLAPLHTVERGFGEGSLTELGRADKLYPARWRHTADRLLAELDSLGLPSRSPMADRIRGSREWAHAVDALLDRDVGRARERLAEACRLFPELSSRASAVLRRLSYAHPDWHDPEERLWFVSTAAAIWPERESPTAAVLASLAERLAAGEPAPDATPLTGGAQPDCGCG